MPRTPRPAPTGQLPFRELWRTDATLRTLLKVTAVDTIGRGSFFTLTALYLTLILGIDAVQVGLGLTIAGAVGVLAALAGGHLADRYSSRTLLICSHVVQGLALAAYVLVRDLPTLIAVAAVVAGAQQFGASVRSAVIGRAFEGDQRVRIRAIMRTVTNSGIAIGTAFAAIPLAFNTADAYRITMVLSAALLLIAAVLLRALDPARVDRASVPDKAPDDAAEPQPAAVAGPHPSPYKNPQFLALTILSGLFAIQFGLFEVAVPLWVVKHTDAPSVIVSPLLIVNTVIAVSLTVSMSRGTATVKGATRAMIQSGWLMAAACALWAWAGSLPMGIVIVVLVSAAVVHTLAEILSSAAGWSLSYELASPQNIGSYQGVFGTGYALAAMVAPVVVTLTAVNMGVLGWAILGVGFLACALGAAAVARRPMKSVPLALAGDVGHNRG